MAEIKNAHDDYITIFRNYLDIINKRDLILSVSKNNIKLWNIKDWNCLSNIKNINTFGHLYSACFLNFNNQIYILSSNCNMDFIDNSEAIRVFDFNGKKIKEIKDSLYATFYIDTYYDKNISKNYIITGNYGYAKSYDYNNNELYKIYRDKCDDSGYYLSLIINCKDNSINLIGANAKEYIRIWNFHTGLLLSEIRIVCNSLSGTCLWDNNYLFVGCEDGAIRLLDIENKKTINIVETHLQSVLSLKKFYHPDYGKCLISQSLVNGNIKLWIIKDYYI